MSRTRFWILLGIGLVSLTACCGLGVLGHYLLRPASTPPTTLQVGWVSPAEDITVTAGETVLLQVWASGNAETPPRYLLLWHQGHVIAYTQGPHQPLTLSTSWTPQHPGVTVLVAQAIDEQGQIRTSPRTITVNPSAGDADADGVPDAQDACPETWGSPENGCVQTGGDALGMGQETSSSDVQTGPSEEGEKTATPPVLYLPNQDGDALPDVWDACPNEPGPPETRGCPLLLQDLPTPQGNMARLCQQFPSWCALWADDDGDGVPNGADYCPQEPGLPLFHGCPLNDWDNNDFLAGRNWAIPATDPCAQLLEPARTLCEIWRGTPPEERPDATVEIQLGQRIYTDVAWEGLVCYAAVNRFWVRLPLEKQYLSGEGGVWDLGDKRQRSLLLQVPLRPLRLVIRCYGYGTRGDWVGAVPLGQISLLVPPSRWDGMMYPATGSSWGPNASGFQVFYRVCAEGCP